MKSHFVQKLLSGYTDTQTHTHTRHTTTEYADVSTTYLELVGNTPFKDTRMADRCEAWRQKGGILPGRHFT